MMLCINTVYVYYTRALSKLDCTTSYFNIDIDIDLVLELDLELI
jgi:hypothetical protein